MPEKLVPSTNLFWKTVVVYAEAHPCKATTGVSTRLKRSPRVQAFSSSSL
jgi:hypothetical protein